MSTVKVVHLLQQFTRIMFNFGKNYISITIYATIWIDGCSLNVGIVSITPKPFILQKISMNLLQMPFIITWAYLCAPFDTLTHCSVYPSAPVLLTKGLSRIEIIYDFYPSFSLHISNSRTKPSGLDF